MYKSHLDQMHVLVHWCFLKRAFCVWWKSINIELIFNLDCKIYSVFFLLLDIHSKHSGLLKDRLFCIIRDLSWCTGIFSSHQSFVTAIRIWSVYREFMIARHVLTTVGQQVVDRKIQHKYKNDINLSHGVCIRS